MRCAALQLAIDLLLDGAGHLAGDPTGASAVRILTPPEHPRCGGHCATA